MTQIKLSICIVFCDKDVNYLKDLIKQIENNIFISYEILLYDNRTSLSDLDIKHKILGQNGINELQSKARVELIKEASGEYIWFVDADDNIFKIPKKFETLNSRIISFGYKMSNNRVFQKKGIFPISWENTIGLTGGQIWDKWFKNTLLKSIVYMLKNKKMVAGEDTAIAILAMSKCEYIEYIPTIIYYYNLNNSSSYGPNYKSYESFKRLLQKDRLKDVIQENLDSNWLNKTHFNIFLEQEPFYLFSFLRKGNKQDWDKIINDILNRYSENEFLLSYVLHFDSWPWVEEAYYYVKDILFNKYPNSFTKENIIRIQKEYNKSYRPINFEEENEEL